MKSDGLGRKSGGVGGGPAAIALMEEVLSVAVSSGRAVVLLVEATAADMGDIFGSGQHTSFIAPLHFWLAKSALMSSKVRSGGFIC